MPITGCCLFSSFRVTHRLVSAVNYIFCCIPKLSHVSLRKRKLMYNIKNVPSIIQVNLRSILVLKFIQWYISCCTAGINKLSFSFPFSFSDLQTLAVRTRLLTCSARYEVGFSLALMNSILLLITCLLAILNVKKV